jgi:carboxymethylenebutenolidase
MPSMLTQTIRIEPSDHTPMGGFLARPPGGPHPGVIVAGELFGLSAHVRASCEQLAAAGYVALAPDLHHRTAPWIELAEDEAGRSRGFALLGQMTRAHVLADLRAALEWLHAHGSHRVGVLGLSVGGHIAYLAAAHLDLQAVAIAYAGWLTSTDIPLSQPEATLTLTSAISAPVLYLVGEHDRLISAAERQEIGEALRTAGVPYELVEYPGAAHGFLNERRDAYDPAAAHDAWQRVHRLFAARLR